MERIERLETSVSMLDRRMTIHETQCESLRGEVREFMDSVRRMIRWAIMAAITGFVSLFIWMFKEVAHIHVGGGDLIQFWISLT